MEFFVICGIVFTFADPYEAMRFGFNKMDTWIVWVIAAALYAVIAVFKAIGLFVMAKKQKKTKLLWCAFLPFASTYLIGELAGEFRLGRTRVKHIGLYAMIAEFLTCVSCAMLYVPQSYIFMDDSLYEIVLETIGNQQYWVFRYTLPDWLNTFVTAAEILEMIFYLIELIAFVFLYMAFFKAYAPASYIWLVLVCVLFSYAAAFIIFAFRNRTPVDYEQIMRARMEQIRRAQQAQYGPYGNPYGGNPYGQNGQNPYGQNPYGGPYGNGPYGRPEAPSAPKQPDDPFGEYSSKSSSDDDPFGEFSGGQGTSSGGSENKGSGGQGGSGPSDDYFS